MVKPTTPAAPVLTFDEVDVPIVSASAPNPFLDKVRDLNARRLAGEDRAAVHVIPAGDSQETAVKRTVSQLRTAGAALGCTVRKMIADQPDGSKRVTFWTSNRRERARKVNADPSASDASAAPGSSK